LHVLFMVTRLVNSPVECDPVSFIVTCLHVPVKHAVSAWVSVPYCVTGGQYLSTVAQINAKEAVGFVMSSAIGRNTSYEILDRSCTDTAGKGLDYIWSMRIEPKAFFACWSEEVESTLLVHIILVHKFSWSLDGKSLRSMETLRVLLLLRLLWSLMC
jgi:hypothetical protein